MTPARRQWLGLLAALPFAVHAATPGHATLHVEKMDCAACPITVRKALERVPGVLKAEVDYRRKTAQVAFDPARTSPEALTRATADAGYPSTIGTVR